ncbi:hypothetical protein HDU93_009076 [Gonapodya sp. JEL0774]|nr:hypothetical protein HDU93_009076 [Gonapodya sp. JEL0774]
MSCLYVCGDDDDDKKSGGKDRDLKADGNNNDHRPFSAASTRSRAPHLDLDLGSTVRFGDMFSTSFYRPSSRASSPGLFRANSVRSNGAMTPPASPSPALAYPTGTSGTSPGVGRLPSTGKGVGKVWSPLTPSPLNPKRRLSNAPPSPTYVTAAPQPIGPPTVASPVSMLASNPFGAPSTGRGIEVVAATPPPTTRPPGHTRAPSLTTTLTSHLTDAHVADNPFSSDASSIISAPSPTPRDRDTFTPEPDGMEVEEWQPGTGAFDVSMFTSGNMAARVASPPGTPRNTTPIPFNNSGAIAGGMFTMRSGSPVVNNPYAFDSVRADSPGAYGYSSYASYAASRFSPTSTSDSGDSTDSGLGPRTPPPPLVKTGGINVPLPKQPIPAAVFHVTFHPPADGRVYAIEEYFPSGTLPGEIALSPGDRVEVYEIAGHGVVRGKNVDTGEEGVFPEWALGRGQAGRGTPIAGLV